MPKGFARRTLRRWGCLLVLVGSVLAGSAPRDAVAQCVPSVAGVRLQLAQGGAFRATVVVDFRSNTATGAGNGSVSQVSFDGRRLRFVISWQSGTVGTYELVVGQGSITGMGRDQAGNTAPIVSGAVVAGGIGFCER